MPSDPESFLGVDPPPSRSPSDSPDTPKLTMPSDPASFLGISPESSGSLPSPEARRSRMWVWLSLLAFFVGLPGMIVGFFLAAVEGWGAVGTMGQQRSEYRLLYEAIFFAGLGLLIVSILCGLRVVKQRRYVLIWVGPTVIFLTLFVAAALHG
jgi:hypothetical protein